MDNLLKISVSFVVPVYSGAKFLESLVGRISNLRDSWNDSDTPLQLSELIFVDDASIDNSQAILDELCKKHEWITTLGLSRNFGQHPATIAGILHSSGDWVVTLDEDLQHPPEEIGVFFESVATHGVDVVYANPETDVHESWRRDLSSKLFKKIMVALTGNQAITTFNSFRLIRGSVARAAASVCGHETYFDVALSWFSRSYSSVTISLKDERMISGGASGYSFSKLLSHARKMLFSSQSKVLRIGAIGGILSVALSFSLSIYFLASRLLGTTDYVVQGWLSTMLAILFFGGVITFLVGICLEFVIQIALQAQGKPTFFVVDRSSDERLKRFFNGA